MKKLEFIIVLAISIMVLPSCGHKPRVKTIPASHVKLSGEHKGFLEIASDEIKVMLVNTEKGCWEVRALIPIKNTAPWSSVTGGDEVFEECLDPRMSSASVVFIDEFGSEIREFYSTSVLDHNTIESVLKSENETVEDMLIKDKRALLGDKSYKTKKRTFDQVDGVVISQLNIMGQQQQKISFDEVASRIETALSLIERASSLGF